MSAEPDKIHPQIHRMLAEAAAELLLLGINGS